MKQKTLIEEQLETHFEIIEDLNKRLKALEEQRPGDPQVEPEPKLAKRWRAEKGEKYMYIIDRRLALVRMQDYALEHMPFEPDWESVEQKKFFVCWDYGIKLFDTWISPRRKMQTDLPVFKSEDDAKNFIIDNEDDLRVWFGVGGK